MTGQVYTIGSVNSTPGSYPIGVSDEYQLGDINFSPFAKDLLNIEVIFNRAVTESALLKSNYTINNQSSIQSTADFVAGSNVLSNSALDLEVGMTITITSGNNSGFVRTVVKKLNEWQYELDDSMMHDDTSCEFVVNNKQIKNVKFTSSNNTSVNIELYFHIKSGKSHRLEIRNVFDYNGAEITPESKEFNPVPIDNPVALGAFSSTNGCVDIVFDRKIDRFSSSQSCILASDFMNFVLFPGPNVARFELPTFSSTDDELYISYSGFLDSSGNEGSGDVLFTSTAANNKYFSSEIKKIQCIKFIRPILSTSNTCMYVLYFNMPTHNDASTVNPQNYTIKEKHNHYSLDDDDYSDSSLILSQYPYQSNIASIVSGIQNFVYYFNKHASNNTYHNHSNELIVYDVSPPNFWSSDHCIDFIEKTNDIINNHFVSNSHKSKQPGLQVSKPVSYTITSMTDYVNSITNNLSLHTLQYITHSIHSMKSYSGSSSFVVNGESTYFVCILSSFLSEESEVTLTCSVTDHTGTSITNVANTGRITLNNNVATNTLSSYNKTQITTCCSGGVSGYGIDTSNDDVHLMIPSLSYLYSELYSHNSLSSAHYSVSNPQVQFYPDDVSKKSVIDHYNGLIDFINSHITDDNKHDLSSPVSGLKKINFLSESSINSIVDVINSHMMSRSGDGYNRWYHKQYKYSTVKYVGRTSHTFSYSGCTNGSSYKFMIGEFSTELKLIDKLPYTSACFIEPGLKRHEYGYGEYITKLEYDKINIFFSKDMNVKNIHNNDVLLLTGGNSMTVNEFIWNSKSSVTAVVNALNVNSQKAIVYNFFDLYGNTLQ